MAHADYNCCAICDSKMDYAGWESETKEDICTYCLENIKKLNLKIENVEDLKKYIKDTDYKTLRETLIKLDYSFCYYSNDIDDLVVSNFQPSGMSFEEYLKRIDNQNYIVIEKVDDK